MQSRLFCVTQRTSSPGGSLLTVAPAPDGTVFTGAADGQVYRSASGPSNTTGQIGEEGIVVLKVEGMV